MPVTQPLQVYIDQIEEIIPTTPEEEIPRGPKLNMACIGDAVIVIKHPKRDNNFANYAVACSAQEPPSL